jgi:hypothetical protein
MRISKTLVIIVVAAIIIIAAVVGAYWRFILHEAGQYKFSPYVCLTPYAYNGYKSLNITYFEEDLDVVKNMGFCGVSLHNLQNFYYEGIIDNVMSSCLDRNLSVIVYFQFVDITKSPFSRENGWWSREGFPYNTTQVDAYVDYVKNVTDTVKNFNNLDKYAIYYPFNNSNREVWRSKIQSQSYSQSLQRIIDAIRSEDTKHGIYLIFDLWDTYPFGWYDLLPKNLLGITGFSFMWYSNIQDKVDVDYINMFLKYMENLHKPYFVAEWGVRTNGTGTHGWATDEASKCEMIKDFLYYMWHKDMVLAYFCLHDFPPEHADWGLIYDNQTLKPSGEAMKEMLTENKSI